MRDEKMSKKNPQKKAGRRILKSVLAILAVLILLTVVLVPVLVSSGKFRSLILAKANDSIEGKLDFASLSMGWWKGIKIKDFRFNDNVGQTSVEVEQITTRPHYGSILMGSLSFGETTIERPRAEINLKSASRQGAGGPARKPSDFKKSGPVVLPVKKIDLVVNDGSVKVTDAKAQTVELSRINSKLSLRPPGQQTNFKLNMAVADAGKKSEISVDGRITPKQKNGWSLEGASGNVTVEVNDLDLGSLAPFFALADVNVQTKGFVSGNVESKIADGQFENLSTNITAKNLDITAPQLKGDRLKTSVLDVNAKLARRQKMMSIENLDIRADWLKAQTTGMLPTALDSFDEFLKSDSTLKGNFELDVAQLLSQMPQTLGAKENMKVTSGRLSGTVTTATEAGKRKITGNASLDGLKGTVDEKTIALRQPVKAEVEITAEKDKVVYDKVGFTASFGKIDCSGISEALKYNANINLESLQAELGQFIDIGQYKMSGELSASGDASIGKDKVAASGSSTVKNLRLSSEEQISATEPMANINYSVVAEPNRSILNVDSIKATASLGEVNIKNAVLPLNKEAQQPMKLAVSANKVDLEKIRPFAVLFASFPKEMQLAGIAESRIDVTSKNDTYYIKTDSTKIRNLKIVYPEKEPFEQDPVSLVAEAEVNPAAKTYVVKWQLISPQIKIKGNIDKTIKSSNARLDAKADCEYDWSAVSALSDPFLPEGFVLEGQRKDAISFTSEYPAEQSDKVLEHLNMDGRFGFDKAHYMGLHLGPTDVDVRVQNGFLNIAPFSTTVNNGRLNFAGQADFKQKPTVLKTPKPIEIAKGIEINDETTSKLLVYLSPIFAGASRVTGVANFSCEQLAIPLNKMDPNELEVVGTVSIDNLRLEGAGFIESICSLFGQGTPGQDFTIRPTKFIVRDGLVRYDDMQLDVGDNPFNFKGVIGLDKTLKNMTVTTPYYVTRDFKFRTARVDEEIEAERISLALTGTTERPEADAGIVEQLLKQILRKQLEDQLKDKILEGLDKLLK